MKAIGVYSGFELMGYHVDYFVDGKYMGSIRLEEKDRENFGYSGRQYHMASENFEVKKGRNVSKIKKGIKYYTELQAICGKKI